MRIKIKVLDFSTSTLISRNNFISFINQLFIMFLSEASVTENNKVK